MGKRNYKAYINGHEAQSDPYAQYGEELVKWEWSKDEATGIISLLKAGVVFRRFRLATKTEIAETKGEGWYCTDNPCPIKKTERLVRIKEKEETTTEHVQPEMPADRTYDS